MDPTLDFSFIVGWLLLVLIAPVVLAPVMVWFMMRIPADMKLRPPDTKSLVFNPTTQSFLNEATNEFKALGFEFVAHLETQAQVMKGQKHKSILTLMRHPETQAVAEALTMVVQAHFGITRKVQVVAMGTEFTDGTQISTKRSKQIEALRQLPQVTSVIYRSKRVSLAEMYRTHQLMVRRFGKTQVLDKLANGPIAMLNLGHRRLMEYQAQCGLMKPCRNGQAWRPTLLGACLMTFKPIWLFKGFFIFQIACRRRRILKEIAGLEGQINDPRVTVQT